MVRLARSMARSPPGPRSPAVVALPRSVRRSSETECPICLEPASAQNTIMLATACGHSFCSQCVRGFAKNVPKHQRSYDCPLCRQQIYPLLETYFPEETSATPPRTIYPGQNPPTYRAQESRPTGEPLVTGIATHWRQDPLSHITVRRPRMDPRSHITVRHPRVPQQVARAISTPVMAAVPTSATTVVGRAAAATLAPADRLNHRSAAHEGNTERPRAARRTASQRRRQQFDSDGEQIVRVGDLAALCTAALHELQLTVGQDVEYCSTRNGEYFALLDHDRSQTLS